jgi:methylaspartate mutase sigma subunit
MPENRPPAARGTAAGLDVVLSSTASDAHTWNLVLLQLMLTEMGHLVTNLGSCVPVGLFVRECRRRRPGLVVISTVNGHGFADGLQLITRLRRSAALTSTPVVIGGKLGIRGTDRGEISQSLLDAGFDAVFADDTPPELFQSFVAALPAEAGR